VLYCKKTASSGSIRQASVVPAAFIGLSRRQLKPLMKSALSRADEWTYKELYRNQRSTGGDEQ